MGREITFIVPGIPATQGSKRGFLAKSGKVIVKESCLKNGDWRGDVKRFAVESCPESPMTGPILPGHQAGPHQAPPRPGGRPEGPRLEG
jgi:hypothetical protein